MTPRDFIYWLKSYFEVPKRTAPAVLTAEQVTIIRRHLAMVPVAQFDRSKLVDPMTGRDFCEWLEGNLEEVTGGLNAERTQKIQERLDRLFKHVAGTPAKPQEPPKPKDDDGDDDDGSEMLAMC